MKKVGDGREGSTAWWEWIMIFPTILNDSWLQHSMNGHQLHVLSGSPQDCVSKSMSIHWQSIDHLLMGSGPSVNAYGHRNMTPHFNLTLLPLLWSTMVSPYLHPWESTDGPLTVHWPSVDMQLTFGKKIINQLVSTGCQWTISRPSVDAHGQGFHLNCLWASTGQK